MYFSAARLCCCASRRTQTCRIFFAWILLGLAADAAAENDAHWSADASSGGHSRETFQGECVADGLTMSSCSRQTLGDTAVSLPSQRAAVLLQKVLRVHSSAPAPGAAPVQNRSGSEVAAAESPAAKASDVATSPAPLAGGSMSGKLPTSTSLRAQMLLALRSTLQKAAQRSRGAPPVAVALGGVVAGLILCSCCCNPQRVRVRGQMWLRSRGL
eukprot:TRINITY_DN112045_c0_g1_i1.p1 TRINITY_DN112045_c0_g1~~TRINITY_DN112045_c0_g1_i1.p1  ORF type:complete len:214 (-),score=39.07 TRINITY_DN112045_c0_g1_i1:82-723(-)